LEKKGVQTPLLKTRDASKLSKGGKNVQKAGVRAGGRGYILSNLRGEGGGRGQGPQGVRLDFLFCKGVETSHQLKGMGNGREVSEAAAKRAVKKIREPRTTMSPRAQVYKPSKKKHI